MKNIIVATAMALSLGASIPALAANDSEMMKTYDSQQQGDFYAADFIGKEIYTSDKEWDENTKADANWQDDWENIGQVENVILNQDGSVKAVILEVGGFLDIGDKHVAVPMESLSFIQNGDSWDNYFLAVKTSREELEGAKEYQRQASAEGMKDGQKQTAMNNEQAGTDGNNQMASDDQATMDGANQTAQNDSDMDNTTTSSTERRTDADGRTLLMPPSIDEREGYSDVSREEMTADRLTGARVYGANDEDVGEISDLVLNTDGTSVERVIIDVGGFLGIGEHTIALTMDEVRIIRDTDWGDIRVYVDSTEDALEKQPAYKG